MGGRQRLAAEAHAQDGDAGTVEIAQELQFAVDPRAQCDAVVHRPDRTQRDDQVVVADGRQLAVEVGIVDGCRHRQGIEVEAASVQCLAEQPGF